jgi:hypothetical protein
VTIAIAIPVGIAVPVLAVPRLISGILVTPGLSVDAAGALHLLVESFLGQVEKFFYLFNHGIRIIRRLSSGTENQPQRAE